MTDWTNSVLTGDCRERLRDLPESSVHAVVTDPPYGLAFMGRSWDDFEPKEYQEWCERWATAVKRVLKPGGHLLAFSGNRTHHRAFTGVEDAGFEIRDTITWHYGSGFPKALDVSKAIDKQEGAEREVVGTYTNPRTGDSHEYANDSETKNTYSEDDRDGKDARARTAPATDAAERWDGFKTALKPATEYVVVARKPLSEGTVAENVQTHGTGALNIDGTRVGTDVDTERKNSGEIGDGNKYSEAPHPDMTAGSKSGGRYPSNVVFDETEAERLDREVGELDAGARTPQTNSGSGEIYGDYANETRDHERQELESGGPSRYFYTSKASKAERTLDGSIDNPHPTVKPTDLMEWLVTLVTAEGQIVLDPFAGSGTTLKAAKQTGRAFVGIERQPEYADIARVRAGLTPTDPANVREDDNQSGLEVFGE